MVEHSTWIEPVPPEPRQRGTKWRPACSCGWKGIPRPKGQAQEAAVAHAKGRGEPGDR